MSKYIKVIAPDKDNFSKFGRVITTMQNTPAINEQNYNWFPDFCLFTEGKALNILTCKERELKISKIERHMQSKEIVMPFGNKEIIVVVGPAGEVLNENEIRAFILSSGTGLVINEGVRHFLPFSIVGDTDCIIIYKHLTEENDLLFEDLSEEYLIDYSI